MKTHGLEKSEAELKRAAQSLWDYRTKEEASPEVSAYLSSAQDAFSDLLQHLSECRSFLSTREAL